MCQWVGGAGGSCQPALRQAQPVLIFSGMFSAGLVGASLDWRRRPPGTHTSWGGPEKERRPGRGHEGRRTWCMDGGKLRGASIFVARNLQSASGNKEEENSCSLVSYTWGRRTPRRWGKVPQLGHAAGIHPEVRYVPAGEEVLGFRTAKRAPP